MEGASLPEPPSMTVERTLAVIKPDAVDKVEEIVEEIKGNGFTILQVTTTFIIHAMMHAIICLALRSQPLSEASDCQGPRES